MLHNTAEGSPSLSPVIRSSYFSDKYFPRLRSFNRFQAVRNRLAASCRLSPPNQILLDYKFGFFQRQAGRTPLLDQLLPQLFHSPAEGVKIPHVFPAQLR